MNAVANYPAETAFHGFDHRTDPLLTEKFAEVVRANYRLRLARTGADVRSAQVLRFLVFNLELQEGFEQSYATCLDADAYDSICDHLLVEDTRTGEVVGTYRLQTGDCARANLGYYSAQEFDFSPFEPLRSQMVELGRACVHSSHRNLVVLSLLWKGIASYAKAYGCRFLIGCSSLTSQDPSMGHAMYRKFAKDGVLAEGSFFTKPWAGYALPSAEPLDPCPPPPKLLRAYLGVGAKICSAPAIDREFGTIDFLTILDCQNGSPIATERFLERPNHIKAPKDSTS